VVVFTNDGRWNKKLDEWILIGNAKICIAFRIEKNLKVSCFVVLFFQSKELFADERVQFLIINKSHKLMLTFC